MQHRENSLEIVTPCEIPRPLLRRLQKNDILKEMIGRGARIFPVEPTVNLIGDTIEYSMTTMPRTNPVSVCGYHIRESGATPAQEIAYALSAALVGAQTTAPCSYDEAYTIPPPHSAVISLRTLQLLMDEIGLREIPYIYPMLQGICDGRRDDKYFQEHLWRV